MIFGTRRLFAGAVVAGLVTAALTVAVQPAASGWNPIGCQWGSATVKYYVGTNAAPTTNFAGARSDWNSVSQANLTEVSVESNRNFKARNNDFGVTGWSGLWHKEGNTSVGVSCSGGIWVNKDGMASVNNHYNSSSAANRRGVAVHEFGHVLGLDHNGATFGSCPGGGADYASVMYPSDNRFNGGCAVFTPTADDIAGINTLY